MIQLKHSCCGCSLTIGCRIIGGIDDFIGFVGLLFAIVSEKAFASIDVKPEFQHAVNVMRGGFVTLGVAGVICMLFAIALQVGVRKKLKNLLGAWILSAILTRVLAFIVGIILVWAYAEIGLSLQGTIIIVIILIYIGLSTYSIIVVNSLKNEFQGNEGTQQQSNAGKV